MVLSTFVNAGAYQYIIKILNSSITFDTVALRNILTPYIGREIVLEFSSVDGWSDGAIFILIDIDVFPNKLLLFPNTQPHSYN